MPIENASFSGAKIPIEAEVDHLEGEGTGFRLSRPWLTGGLASLATLPLHFLLPVAASIQLSAIFLALIAGVYVGFAVRDGRIRFIALESGVALLFVLAASWGGTDVAVGNPTSLCFSWPLGLGARATDQD